jgi:hypothetical protein
VKNFLSAARPPAEATIPTTGVKRRATSPLESDALSDSGDGAEFAALVLNQANLAGWFAK